MKPSRNITAIRAVLAVAALGTLTACATSGGGHAASVVPAGSVLVLDRTLDMPPGGARVHIQGGRVVPEGDINRFVPHCSFGLRLQSGDEALIGAIRPGRFDTGRSRSWAQARREPGDGVRVAARGWPMLARSRERGGLIHLRFRTEIPLGSAEQPQVDDLTCQYDGEPYDGYLTLEQIRSALGPIASLRVAGE